MAKPKTDPGSLVINNEFIEIVSKLLRYFNGNVFKTRAWLVSPNPGLGYPPLKLIVMGRGHKVLDFINDKKDDWVISEWTLTGMAKGVHIEGPIVPSGVKIKVREIIDSDQAQQIVSTQETQKEIET